MKKKNAKITEISYKKTVKLDKLPLKIQKQHEECRRKRQKKEREPNPYRSDSLPYYIIIFVKNIYIMPPIPGLPIGIAGSFSGLSQMTLSVVRNMPAMLAAFSKATRATLAGSMTPTTRRSSY